MSQDKSAALVAINGTYVDVSIILQRDQLLYGAFHPMNESVAPLQQLSIPIRRHQNSLPSRILGKFEYNLYIISRIIINNTNSW